MQFDSVISELLNEGHKVPKRRVKYTQGKEKYRCMFCKYFEKPNKCHLVIGNIDYNALCSLFEPKTGKKNDRVTAPETPDGGPAQSFSPALSRGVGKIDGKSGNEIAQAPVA